MLAPGQNLRQAHGPHASSLLVGVLPKPKGARVSHPQHVPGRMAVRYSKVFCQGGAAAAENSRVPDELGNTPL
jgi:hypothetical protein